jgi:hypothetical protein
MAVVAVAAIVATAVLVLNLIAGQAACKLENTNCAASHLKNGYFAGVIIDPQTQTPIANQHLAMYFESRRDYGVTLSTDTTGHYCIVWANDPLPRVKVGNNYNVILRDPWRPLDGQPPPPGCSATNADIPWNRAVDLRSNWRYKLLLWLPGLALATLALRSLLRKSRLKELLSSVGLAASAACVSTFVAFWA